MSTSVSVGKQLGTQELYARQKARRAGVTYLPAPTIIAAGLQVPENIGSVLRLADAAGSPRVIFINEGDISHPSKRIQRTARNADMSVEWAFWTEAEFMESSESFQPLIALELTTNSTSIFENTLPDECTFVVGSERYGIPPVFLEQCQRGVHIPMYGVNGSMNVTHALAIALFEWRRQHPEPSQQQAA